LYLFLVLQHMKQYVICPPYNVLRSCFTHLSFIVDNNLEWTWFRRNWYYKLCLSM